MQTGQIYIIGDVHTVSAFRLAGAVGIVSTRERAAADLEDAIRKEDAVLVAITNGLAEGIEDRIGALNLDLPETVVVAIPGIGDKPALGRPASRYVSEALGIPL